MGMRLAVGLVGMVLSAFLALPPVHAADENATAEAAPVESEDATREQILQEIDATREIDPELAAEMERQLDLWESGQLDLTAERQVAFEGSAGAAGQGTPELLGPPVEGGTTGMPSYMTPELRDQLFNVFDGVGRGELTEDQARGQAEAIMREHGIDPREMSPGHEGTEQEHREAFERAMEQMSPEAREQMERQFQEHEHEMAGHEMDRETFERDYSLERAFEAPEHEYEAPEQHEYEAPEAPEAPETPEAPEHEQEAPEHEYEAPEPGDGGEGGAPEYDAPPQ